MTRARAADDFDAIYNRIRQLRGEPTLSSSQPGEPPALDAPPSEKQRRITARREGLPPPWVPTIFLKRPTNSEIACRFWHARSGW